MPAPRISSQPVCLQMRQPLTFAGGAADIDFKARLNEREIAGAKAGFYFFAKEFVQEFIHRRKEIGKGDPFIDVKAFDLMEKDVGSGRIVSLRKQRPGAMIRIGGANVSIAWTWTLLVWVRRSQSVER